MNFVSDHAFDSVLASHGLARPSTKAAVDESRSALSQAAFKVARRLIDMLRIVSTQKTLQPENVQNLARLSELLRSTLMASPGSSKSGSRKAPVHAIHGGAVILPGSYFDPDNSVDAARYSTANASDFTASFPSAPGADGLVRFPMEASSEFPVNYATGGGGKKKNKPANKTKGGAVILPGSYFDPDNSADAARYSTANASDYTASFPSAPGADGLVRFPMEASSEFPVNYGGGSSTRWFTDDALSAILREYKARSGAPELRISEGAKAIVRRIVEMNLDGIVKASLKGKISSKSSINSNKKKTMSGGAITKAANAWILMF